MAAVIRQGRGALKPMDSQRRFGCAELTDLISRLRRDNCQSTKAVEYGYIA